MTTDRIRDPEIDAVQRCFLYHFLVQRNDFSIAAKQAGIKVDTARLWQNEDPLFGRICRISNPQQADRAIVNHYRYVDWKKASDAEAVHRLPGTKEALEVEPYFAPAKAQNAIERFRKLKELYTWAQSEPRLADDNRIKQAIILLGLEAGAFKNMNRPDEVYDAMGVKEDAQRWGWFKDNPHFVKDFGYGIRKAWNNDPFWRDFDSFRELAPVLEQAVSGQGKTDDLLIATGHLKPPPKPVKIEKMSHNELNAAYNAVKGIKTEDKWRRQAVFLLTCAQLEPTGDRNSKIARVAGRVGVDQALPKAWASESHGNYTPEFRQALDGISRENPYAWANEIPIYKRALADLTLISLSEEEYRDVVAACPSDVRERNELPADKTIPPEWGSLMSSLLDIKRNQTATAMREVLFLMAYERMGTNNIAATARALGMEQQMPHAWKTADDGFGFALTEAGDQQAKIWRNREKYREAIVHINDVLERRVALDKVPGIAKVEPVARDWRTAVTAGDPPPPVEIIESTRLVLPSAEAAEKVSPPAETNFRYIVRPGEQPIRDAEAIRDLLSRKTREEEARLAREKQAKPRRK